VASLSQGRTAAAQCGLFTHKSIPVIFEPPCICVAAILYVTFYKIYNRIGSDALSSSIPMRHFMTAGHRAAVSQIAHF